MLVKRTRKETKTVPGKTGVDIELDRWRELAQALLGLDSEHPDARLRQDVDKMLGNLRLYVNTLNVRNQRLAYKLTRIVETIPANVEYLSDEKSLFLSLVRDIAMEQLPPHDPAAVEISRAGMLAEIDDVLQKAGLWAGGRLDTIKRLLVERKEMAEKIDTIISNVLDLPNDEAHRALRETACAKLDIERGATLIENEHALAEIDDVLQKAGCWRGGRLDSITELVTRHNGMRACLTLVSEWIARDGPAIRSWLVDGEEVKP